jgi:integration host factor subunit beta
VLRSDLIKSLWKANANLGQITCEQVVNAFFDAIAEHLANGGRVEIRDFGSFTTRAREARTGRNPRSGEAVAVNAKRALRFKPGKLLSERIDGKAVV